MERKGKKEINKKEEREEEFWKKGIKNFEGKAKRNAKWNNPDF